MKRVKLSRKDKKRKTRTYGDKIKSGNTMYHDLMKSINKKAQNQ